MLFLFFVVFLNHNHIIKYVFNDLSDLLCYQIFQFAFWHLIFLSLKPLTLILLNYIWFNYLTFQLNEWELRFLKYQVADNQNLNCVLSLTAAEFSADK